MIKSALITSIVLRSYITMRYIFRGDGDVLMFIPEQVYWSRIRQDMRSYAFSRTVKVGQPEHSYGKLNKGVVKSGSCGELVQFQHDPGDNLLWLKPQTKSAQVMEMRL